MNWYKIFYLVSIADNLETFFGWMCAIFTLVAGASSILFSFTSMAVADGEENAIPIRDAAKKWIWWATPFFVFFWLAYIATPSKKDMILIIAGGAVGEFVTTDKNAKEIPADVVKFLRVEILKMTSEVEEETKEALGIKSKTDVLRDSLRNLSREQLEELILKDK